MNGMRWPFGLTTKSKMIWSSISSPPVPTNEPVYDYLPGSIERAGITAALRTLSAERADIALVIDGKEIRTGRTYCTAMPHRHKHALGDVHVAGDKEVREAVAAACRSSSDWSRTAWEDRAAVFLKAADLLSGPHRERLNAATMLGQSKTVHQAEIDAAAELCDFFRFNVAFMRHLYENQPLSDRYVWNRSDYRPLDGFVYAISPFNFTSIAGNLPTAPALMGNTVIWKPAATAAYSAHFIMSLLREAGLPPGVINLVNGTGPDVSRVVLADPRMAGVHFTGSTATFDTIWRAVASNLSAYQAYPRLVGETGGKNFIVAHASANLEALSSAIIRGAFEYQGQKCSAASRIYVPESLWPRLRDRLIGEIGDIRYGDISDFRNFMGAVIDRSAYEKYARIALEIRNDSTATLLTGAECDDDEGYLVAPTLVLTDDFNSRLLCEEFFLPICACFVYPDHAFADLLKEIDATSSYGLTGAIFATSRAAIAQASMQLRHTAGNFYVNDKPTGAVVGQQPFGGGRRSGTNDKAGSLWNLMRWVSPRTVKENFVPPTDWRYPYMSHRVAV
jgi:1-pyrroline-5-carboxylate dehydrogenase